MTVRSNRNRAARNGTSRQIINNLRYHNLALFLDLNPPFTLRRTIYTTAHTTAHTTNESGVFVFDLLAMPRLRGSVAARVDWRAAAGAERSCVGCCADAPCRRQRLASHGRIAAAAARGPCRLDDGLCLRRQAGGHSRPGGGRRRACYRYHAGTDAGGEPPPAGDACWFRHHPGRRNSGSRLLGETQR